MSLKEYAAVCFKQNEKKYIYIKSKGAVFSLYFCFFCLYNKRKGDVECQELFVKLAHILPINMENI